MFLPENEMKEASITKFTLFLKGNLADSQYLAISNCDYKQFSNRESTISCYIFNRSRIHPNI